MKNKNFSTKFAGRNLTIKISNTSPFSNAGCWVFYGNTTVMVHTVMSKQQRQDIDFFPLSVEYEEKFYAAGKIPGSYLKRESKPSENVAIIGHKKMTTRIDSEGDNVEFKPSEQWANSCDNEEAALYYLSKDWHKIKPDNLKIAVELLKKSDTPISHYNMATLIAHGILCGNKTDALRHFAFVQNSKEISQKYFNCLKRDIDQME